MPFVRRPARRFHLFATAILVFVGFNLLATEAVAANPAKPRQLYTCGMHPQVIADKPGNCPICGMKLVPILSDPATGAREIKYYESTMIPGETSSKPGKDSMGMDMVPVYETGGTWGAIHIDPETIQRMNLKTAVVARGPMRREIHTVGTIAYDEAGLTDITTKYEGWVEKLEVNATWTSVRQGDPLFEVYSPDLYNAELNYVVALRAEGDHEGPLGRSALARLQLFDVPERVIADLRRTRTATRTLVYRAPASGIVIQKNVVQGQMIRAGETIFQLADLSHVWVLAQIYEKDVPYVHPGESVTVRTSYGAPRTYTGTISLLLPQVQDTTRTVTARIVLPNPEGLLRPGMYADVSLASVIDPDAVLVPDMAVLRSGERNTVFIARPDGSFEPREVRLGAYSEGDFYQVLNGLTAGERIVTSGQFMLDSESQLQEAIQKMMMPSAETAEPPPKAPRQTSPSHAGSVGNSRSTVPPMRMHAPASGGATSGNASTQSVAS
ncbi:MAG TPA: efflux RND transporter periplasmic adaptor subunit [Opitutaceae bacterium]|nr:efflux RND transporter periplasmic adaptor subunit [Opitutaceae bacterium]